MAKLMSRDDVVRHEYSSVAYTVEDIVEDPKLSSLFLKRVNKKLPRDVRFDQKELNHRLFTLRKRGEENGGLPRKHRSYSGRDLSKKKPR